MVVEWFLEVFSGALAFLIGLLPTIEPPAWLSSGSTYMGDAAGFVSDLGNVLPIGALALGLVWVLACGAVALAVRFGRMGLSLFTGGGGSAA